MHSKLARIKMNWWIGCELSNLMKFLPLKFCAIQYNLYHYNHLLYIINIIITNDSIIIIYHNNVHVLLY